MRTVLLLVALVASAAASAQPLTLEQIMADPDWIGNSPESPFISADSRSVYYQRKENGSELRSLWRVPLAGGAPEKLSTAATASAEAPERIVSGDHRRVAWLRGGNVYLAEGANPRQLTRTGEATALLEFIGTSEIAYRAADRIVAVDLKTGLPRLLASLRVVDDPDWAKIPKTAVAENEERLFDIVKEKEARRVEKAKEDRELAAQTASAPRPIYFGKDKSISTVSLSPDGQHLIVGLTAAELRGRREKLPVWVNAEGYLDPTDARTKVGTDKPNDETLYLVDLPAGTKRKLSVRDLPGIDQDPLAKERAALAVRKKARDAAEKKAHGEEAAPAEKKVDETPAAAAPAGEAAKVAQRPIYVNGSGRTGVRWTEDGRRVALDLFSYDNKDRWLAEVDWAAATVKPLHRLTDAKWVADGAFNEFDWLPDGSFWFTSEETGYSHLYVRRGAETRALTQGKFEVNAVQVDPIGGWFYYRANKPHPGTHEVYRVKFDGTGDEAVSALGGDNSFELSVDGRQLVIVHATTTRPPELYAQAAQPHATARELTKTVSEAFAQIAWVKPEVVAVPSRAGGDPIYARVYRNAATQTGARRPAVMFIHGAGYLQNAHFGWSTYFREFMFHELLLQHGYVVIDIDYRASAGYGRDWRTAIYRQFGTPELEDCRDGVEWLVANANVDRACVGVYGGSYGGFMTLWALFRAPELFAAGAALRPVTDWAHYNHGYTSNILNTPDLDPEAYKNSSPIEYAAGLQRPLLICHGMVDDNVFFEDTVRLTQRLIELKKDMFDVAFYPVESHGFREPTSWLDEYRRIFRLMEREVKNRRTEAGGRRTE